MTEDVLTLERPEDYRVARLHLFPSRWAWDWFVRHHRDELVAAGALVKPCGHWMVCASAFDRVVMAVGQRRAAGR